MTQIEKILSELRELKSSLKAEIEYEERKENIDMCKLLQNDLLKVIKAIHALED